MGWRQYTSSSYATTLECNMSDSDDNAVYNAVYNRHVCAPFPTRTTVQGGLGREGLLMEIASVAALATPR
jgi:enamine deaminase RidA (YjgF/YER057c/UK114 family)